MASTLVPVEEYLRNLNDTHCEYVDGILIEKPMPTWMHAILQAWISALIMRQYPKYLAGGEVHSKLRPTEFRLPDIAVQLRSVAQQETYKEHPPILCVEILFLGELAQDGRGVKRAAQGAGEFLCELASRIRALCAPEDRLGSVFAKCERYHDWGVPVCWIVDPLKRRVWIYERAGEPTLAANELLAADIHLSMMDVFSILDSADDEPRN